jgi:hypothetical protein
MAVVDKIFGNNLQVIVDGVTVGCAESFGIDISVKELNATCTGSGNLEQARPGRQKVTFDLSGLWKQTSIADITTNKTSHDFYANIAGGTEITVVFGLVSPSSGDITYTGTGYFKSLKLSGNNDEIGKYSANGWLNTFSFVRTV